MFTSDFQRRGTLSDPISDPSRTLSAPQTQDEHRHQLIVGFGFSRWFFVTYQAAVISVVLLAAARKRYETWTRSRRKRRRGESAGREDSKSKDAFTKQATASVAEGWSSSSSSSTQESHVSPPAPCVIESDPLLASDHEKLRRTSASTLLRMRRWLKAALMYQPRPLPILNRIIPENETTLWILLLLGLNMFYVFYHVDYSTPTFIEIISDRSGLMFVANLPWLYLLAAKNQPLKALTGQSYENLNLLHRRQGELMCMLAAMHFFGMIFAWWHFLRPLHFGLYRFLTINYIFWGDFAFIAYEVLYLTSLSSFREWWYEMFLASHVFLQTAGLVLLYLHHWRGRPYVLTSLIIFLLDRIVWRLGKKTTSVRADLEVMEDGETVKVSADWPVIPRTRSVWRSWLGWNMSYGWDTSQHTFLTVPGISKQHVLQFHPMTIASAAPEPGQEHAWFNLIIRAKTGFSRDLLHYANDHTSAQIRLDGPYGSLHALEMLQSSDISIIVAGGSGIAVAYPMLWSLLHSESKRKQQVCLIWVVQEASHVKWIGEERLEELKTLGLHLVIPPPSRTHGRPDVAGLFCDNVHELAERVETLESAPKIGVVVSGPDSLNRSVRNTCSRLVRRQGIDIDVAVEKFGW